MALWLRVWACGLSRLIVYGFKMAVGVLASLASRRQQQQSGHSFRIAAWAQQFKIYKCTGQK